jgi:hypothetical protein
VLTLRRPSVGERRRAHVVRYFDINVRVAGGRWGFAGVLVVVVVVREAELELSWTSRVKSRWVGVGLLPGNLFCRYWCMSCGRARTSVARAVSVSCE